jgi:flavin reductase (DIM6/NTAB) family NADH-FMN oxidoreductase RutF
MEKRIDREALGRMDRWTRAALVNSVPGFKSVVLVGTQNAEGITNLAVFNSVVHVGSNPPLIGLMFRPRTADVGHTYRNAKKSGCYTINLLQLGFLDAAHQASAKYPEQVSEFEACGLQPLFSPGFDAPYVAESPVRIGLRWLEEHPVAANGTSFVVGAVEEIFLPEECLGPDGHVNLAEAGVLAGSGGDGYGPAGPFLRLPYIGSTAAGEGQPT